MVVGKWCPIPRFVNNVSRIRLVAMPRFALKRWLCYLKKMRKSLLLLTFVVCAAILGWAADSDAQMRQLPLNGKRGLTGESMSLPLVRIGRETLKLAPGGLIFDTQNRTIVHAALPVGADVWYQVNTGGDVQRIYILTPLEQQRLDQAKK